MLPAEVKRKRRRHGASWPGGTESAAGWRFRVFFVDSRNAALEPAEDRQVQQEGQQAGQKSPGCTSSLQTRRYNNHGCRVRKRRVQHKGGVAICNKEIGASEADHDLVPRSILMPSRRDGAIHLFHARTGRTSGAAHGRGSELFEQGTEVGVLLEHGVFHGLHHGFAGFAALLG